MKRHVHRFRPPATFLNPAIVDGFLLAAGLMEGVFWICVVWDRL